MEACYLDSMMMYHTLYLSNALNVQDDWVSIHSE